MPMTNRSNWVFSIAKPVRTTELSVCLMVLCKFTVYTQQRRALIGAEKDIKSLWQVFLRQL